LRIGIVGGLDRNESQFQQMASQAGHQVECHIGHLSGPRVAGLRSLIERSDVLVIVTGVNSHAAVLMARRLARSRRLPVLLPQRFGRTQLAALLRSNAAAGAS
jgi:hypothetical protein